MRFIVKVISFLYGSLPRSGRWFLGCCLAFLWWHLLRQRRFHVYRNISIVFPSWSKEQKRKLAWESIKWTGFHLLEFLRVPSLSEADLKTGRIQIIGSEHFDQARSFGKGVLILSCHIGNPDIALNGLALAGFPVTLITKRLNNPFFDKLWFDMRKRAGLGFINAHGKETAFQIFKALGQNQGVVFVLDQFMGPPYGIESTFFGKKTGTAYGLARFFEKSQAPIVPCYTYQDKQGVTYVVFEAPTMPSFLTGLAKLPRDQRVLALVNHFNQRIEQMVLARPEQWMWVHRRWKKWEIR